MFPAARQQSEEEVKTHQRQAAGQPAAQEFAEEQLRPREWLRQEREQSPVFALRRDLASGCGDGND